MNVAIAAVIAGVLGTGGEIMPLLGFIVEPADSEYLPAPHNTQLLALLAPVAAKFRPPTTHQILVLTHSRACACKLAHPPTHQLQLQL